MINSQTSILSVKGIGEKVFLTLQKQNITKVIDLLLQLPLRYVDLSSQAEIISAPAKKDITIKAKLLKLSEFYKNRRLITKAVIEDSSGQLSVFWFNNKFVKKNLKMGEEYYFSGQINDRRIFVQPKFEKTGGESIHTGRIVPIYSQSIGIKPGSFRRIIKNLLSEFNLENDYSYEEHLDKNVLKTALYKVHFPETLDDIVIARKRIAVEEILGLIHHSQMLKSQWQKNNTAFIINDSGFTDNFQSSIVNFQFKLTSDQQNALKDISADLAKPHPMNRLLMGDVGSGKTIVALLSMYQVCRSGHSACLIAPTRVLAEQHYQTAKKIFPDLNIELVTGQKKEKLTEAKFFIGTHALINKLEQINPGLVVFDEQQRFGVKQRSVLSTPSLVLSPHILTMTATPIPRSLILTIFSHLSVSQIKELPNGPKDIQTIVTPELKRQKAYEWLFKEIGGTPNHKLALIVCPFINESEYFEQEKIAAVKTKFQETKDKLRSINYELRIDMLHSKLSKIEQEKVIKKLYDQQIDILVTTSMVEVGVDIPTADIVVIENAERFGLSSLHQIRGRVGRRGQKAYCLLFSANQGSKKRLEYFAKTLDGFAIADYDLKNRGPGEIFGVIQHGLSDLKYANWADSEAILQAQQIYNQIRNKKDLKFLIEPKVNAEEVGAN